MRFFAVATLLVALAAAAPTDEVESLEKLACTKRDCISQCCKQYGNCNFFTCSESYCGGLTPVCKCVCRRV
ncbi:hypothetical protein DER44DRAFT_795190 [Fusarium oxysporum]|nr:hypothetical protein DER44DRAFT_795190 [Fusarium oxysporum]